ncbi:MAG: 2-oxoacid:acceptor oxidoreductase family protein, partial [Pseudomonadota bacterium]
MAVGGQGGGVLTGWIAALGERAGWHVQATSVAGVAQRTGATIYYIEMAPDGPRGRPVFALSPAPGHVDVLIAAEIMEAGRAAQRGFVTPDRTVLVASTHRILAVSEKQVPGDGRGDGAEVLAALRSHAAEIVAFDMEALAREAGSVISASLFGGLARSGALPFAAAEFEAVIAASGRGVEASLAAFRGALDWQPPAVAPPASEPGPEMAGPEAMLATPVRNPDIDRLAHDLRTRQTKTLAAGIDMIMADL